MDDNDLIAGVFPEAREPDRRARASAKNALMVEARLAAAAPMGQTTRRTATRGIGYRIGTVLALIVVAIATGSGYLAGHAAAGGEPWEKPARLQAQIDFTTNQLEACLQRHGATPHLAAEGTGWTDPGGRAAAACAPELAATRAVMRTPDGRAWLDAGRKASDKAWHCLADAGYRIDGFSTTGSAPSSNDSAYVAATARCNQQAWANP